MPTLRLVGKDLGTGMVMQGLLVSKNATMAYQGVPVEAYIGLYAVIRRDVAPRQYRAEQRPGASLGTAR
jgi:hypothetical protein